MFYEIAPVQIGQTTYYAVFDNQSNTSSPLFKSWSDAWDALSDRVADAPDDEPVFARDIK